MDENIKSKKRKKGSGDFEVEIINGKNHGVIEELINLEEKCFPLEMRNADSENYYDSVLVDLKNVNLILKYKRKIVGFLIAKEYDLAYDNLTHHDPDLRLNKRNYFYIDFVQIYPRFKLNGGLSLLICKLVEKALEKKIKGLCLHARRKNGFSQFFQKMFNGQKHHSVDNWLGFGEEFDYLEMAVNKNISKKIINQLKINARA
jgi:hypothetical protein